jgi:hypothetical protein
METALALETQLILNGYTGAFNIHDNDGSGLVTCDNEVCTGNYIIDDIDTSGDINALSGCTEITGSLTIKNTTLTNLTGLENITNIGGDLRIVDNFDLTSLGGLSNLTSVNSLYILNNHALTSISALSNVTNVVQDLYINSNLSLTSLTGLENITSLGKSLQIYYNESLTSLIALSNLTNVGLDLYITNNFSLTNLEGMNNLSNVGRLLYIEANYVLNSISALSNLTSVDGEMSLYISHNNTLTTLGGLENLTSLNGLDIYSNDALTNLCGLYNVNSIERGLVIYDNTSLSMDTAYALERKLRSNGFTGSAFIMYNNGTEQVFCDDDEDDDGIENDLDNCPNTCNSQQLDADGDDIGDLCDWNPGCTLNGGCGQTKCEQSCDIDNDGFLNNEDNCPSTCNSQQLDADNDGIGDACDPDPNCGSLCGQGDPCELECHTMTLP